MVPMFQHCTLGSAPYLQAIWHQLSFYYITQTLMLNFKKNELLKIQKNKNEKNWSLVFNMSIIPEAMAVVTAVAKRMSPEHALLDL